MSTCIRCGALFGCAMAEGLEAPCWCVSLPAVVPVPGVDASCWCPACLKLHIEQEREQQRAAQQNVSSSPANQ